MRYFILKQDRSFSSAVKTRDFNDTQKLILSKEDQKKYKDGLLLHVNGDKNSVFPDLFEAPVLLISERLYTVFQWYENTIIYKTCMLVNSDADKRENYRVCILDVLQALSEKTTYLKNGWVDKIVLDSQKIGDYNIFFVKAGVDHYLIVSMDVVESMLKREILFGIKFDEVEVD